MPSVPRSRLWSVSGNRIRGRQGAVMELTETEGYRTLIRQRYTPAEALAFFEEPTHEHTWRFSNGRNLFYCTQPGCRETWDDQA